jgi:hypothetical protein
VGLCRREGGNGLSQAWQNEELAEDAEPEWQTRIFEGRVEGRGLRPWLHELSLYCGSVCSPCKLFGAKLCTYLAYEPRGERPLRKPVALPKRNAITFSQRANPNIARAYWVVAELNVSATPTPRDELPASESSFRVADPASTGKRPLPRVARYASTWPTRFLIANRLGKTAEGQK